MINAHLPYDAFSPTELRNTLQRIAVVEMLSVNMKESSSSKDYRLIADGHLYVYSNNMPDIFTDPYGLHTADDCDREYKLCCASCEVMPNRTRWQKCKRALCWKGCMGSYAACLATSDEAITLGLVGAGVAIIIFDIVTVPSGEGAIGVALIKKALGG
jgi:hypothetical protein